LERTVFPTMTQQRWKSARLRGGRRSPGLRRKYGSGFQQIGLTPDDHLVQRLEVEPTDGVAADLAGGVGGVGRSDVDGRARRLGQQLRLAGPVHGDEPER